jgi:hypothetical protein
MMSMSPIQKATDEIRFRIPREILEETFIRREPNLPQNLVSIDTRIREAILEPRVFTDIDITGGTDAYFPLQNGVNVDPKDPFTVIYTIPDELTQGRPIVQVYGIHFGILGYQNAGLFTHHAQSSLSGNLQRVLDSAQQSTPIRTSYLNIIAHNTIMARYVHAPNVSSYIHVRLGNDDALSHIRHQAYHAFANLCVLATKAYVYNKLRIQIDEGFLSGGQTLGSFLDTVMGYADADEMYRDELNRFKKISILNDPERRRSWARTIVGSP